MAAAVGSLMSVSTCIPAAPAHSLVACRATPLEFAGIVTTDLTNVSLSVRSASFFRRLKSMTAICSVRRFCPTNGTRSGVPRMRLIERIERCSSKFSLASCPNARVPSRRMVTIEGVHFWPSWLGTTSAWPNWKLATTELLVPKSIPMYAIFSPRRREEDFTTEHTERHGKKRSGNPQEVEVRCLADAPQRNRFMGGAEVRRSADHAAGQHGARLARPGAVAQRFPGAGNERSPRRCVGPRGSFSRLLPPSCRRLLAGPPSPAQFPEPPVRLRLLHLPAPLHLGA